LWKGSLLGNGGNQQLSAVLKRAAIVVAIATGIGSLAVSVATYVSQQERERVQFASNVLLVPGRDAALLQNFGDLPALNVILFVAGVPGVIIGTLLGRDQHGR
jgi:hypothetical protein